jgi:hypothetical protein
LCAGDGEFGIYGSVLANLDWIKSAAAGFEPPFGLQVVQPNYTMIVLGDASLSNDVTLSFNSTLRVQGRLSLAGGSIQQGQSLLQVGSDLSLSTALNVSLSARAQVGEVFRIEPGTLITLVIDEQPSGNETAFNVTVENIFEYHQYQGEFIVNAVVQHDFESECAWEFGAPEWTYGATALSVSVAVSQTCPPGPRAPKNRLSAGQIAGIAIGCMLGAVLIGCLIGLWWRYEKAKYQKLAKERAVEFEMSSLGLQGRKSNSPPEGDLS